MVREKQKEKTENSVAFFDLASTLRRVAEISSIEVVTAQICADISRHLNACDLINGRNMKVIGDVLNTPFFPNETSEAAPIEAFIRRMEPIRKLQSDVAEAEYECPAKDKLH